MSQDMKKQIIGITCILLTSAAHAQTAQFSAGQWRTFTMAGQGGTVCYIASQPTAESGNFKKRGTPFVMVTHRNSTTDEVSVSSGYPYKETSEVPLIIDGKTTALFTKQDRAWAKDAATDSALVASMKRGTRMSVKGESRVGSTSQDSYSLSGFTAAYNKMKELCK
jgi:invasion protein IalB